MNLSKQEASVRSERTEDIFLFAKAGNEGGVRREIEKGVNVNSSDDNNWTPLHCSARNGEVTVSRLLLERGAEVNTTDNEGWAPLHCSAEHGHLEETQLLLERGAEVNKVTNYRRTPLHYSAMKGHFEVSELLLRRGANVNAHDKVGRSPLYCAVENGHVKVFQLLLYNGADPDSLNATIYGKTAFERCSDKSIRDDIRQRLEEHRREKQNEHRQCQQEIARLKNELREEQEKHLQPRVAIDRFRKLLSQYQPGKEFIDIVLESSQNEQDRPSEAERALVAHPLFRAVLPNNGLLDLPALQNALLQLLLSLKSVKGAQKGLEALDYIREVEPALRRSLETNARCSELTDAASVFRFANDPTHVGTFASETARKSLRESVFAPKDNINNEGLQGSLRRVLEASDRLRVDLLSYTSDLYSDLSSDLSWTGLEEPTSLRTSVRTFMEKLDSVQDSVEEHVLSSALSALSDIPSEVGQSCTVWREYSEKRRGLHDRLLLLQSLRNRLETAMEQQGDSFVQLKVLKQEMESNDLEDSQLYKDVIKGLLQSFNHRADLGLSEERELFDECRSLESEMEAHDNSARSTGLVGTAITFFGRVVTALSPNGKRRTSGGSNIISEAEVNDHKSCMSFPHA